MDKLKQILKRIFFLPFWAVLLISVPSFALVIYALVSTTVKPEIEYLSYGLSAYALCICAAFTIRMGELTNWDFRKLPVVLWFRSDPTRERILTDPEFRTKLSLYSGLAINLAYVGIKLLSGFLYNSLWFAALAVYYLLLSALRYALLRHVIQNPAGQELISEYKRYRLCGVMLLIMNQALAIIVAMIVERQEGYNYPGYLIYVMAVYSFYAVISSVMNIVKYRKLGSPVLSAVKAVSLTAALVSILSLETAMLSQFGNHDDPMFRRIMTAATGGAVCLIVLVMAIYMIAKATKSLSTLRVSPKGENANG